MNRSDLIVVTLIPVLAALGLLALIVMLATGHAVPPFHPMQLRTV